MLKNTTGMKNFLWTSYQTLVCDEGMHMIHVLWSHAFDKANSVPLNDGANKTSITYSP